MLEKPKSRDSFPRSSGVEETSLEATAAQANYEGNYSLLLIERLRNPVIQNQLIDLLIKGGQARERSGDKDVTLDSSGEVIFNTSGKIVHRKTPYVARTSTEVKAAFFATLDQIATSTPINFEGEGPSETSMPAAWIHNGIKQSDKVMSLVEAHEKGHQIRRYGGDFFDQYFAKGFDRKKIHYSDTDMAFLRKEYPGETDTNLEKHVTMYLMRATELAERMAQLKNYFGMSGNDVFTSAHLTYARSHYLEDITLDNWMTQFFQAITPQTEREFIRIINSSGI